MTLLLRVIMTSLFLGILTTLPAVSQRIIRNIVFDQRDVFDPEHDDWFFAAGVANALHVTTKPYILEDELQFMEGDDIDTVLLLETERNLRRTGLFSKVFVQQEAIGRDSVDIVVHTQDSWSLKPALLFGTGGGITNIGVKLEEINFLGTATQIMGYGLFRTENDIGWEGMLQVSQRRLFRSEIGMVAALRANSIRTNQLLTFTKPYRTIETPWAFSLSGSNDFGKDFAYGLDSVPVLLPFHDRSVTGWISQAYGDDDRLFISGAASINSIRRAVAESRQAFDNTGYFLVAFSSIRQDFRRSTFLNGYETEDIMEGAWGSAILGRVFSMGNGGETMWYVGGVGEQSWFPHKDVYLYGTIGAGTGFAEGIPRYTYLEINGLGHWRASPHIVLAARIRSQTAWNWNAYRQLVLDFESGLRGYAANQLSGDNRFVGNAEFRWFPGWKAWILGISTVAFYDVGTAWNQGIGLTDARYHHAIGLGFRLHNLKASGSDAILRFDFAYNLDERKFTGLIFSTNQLFSAFGSHQYKAPNVLGAEIDTQ
ncbi:MAG: hypothetical protein EHM43_05465 [Ignavibacteriae bacterium]|nr:MAG: hypothetical protein EHM43_05465 [Ignavibacteriota bacterium]